MSTDSNTTMPALPEPYEVMELWGQNVAVYDRTQMREYAKAYAQALQREVEELRRERDELAQQRGDLAAQVLDLQVASGLLARLYLAAGCVPQGTLSDGEFAFLRGAWMRAGNYLRLLPEDARPGTVASDSQPSEQTR